jgi:hypothetical protein
MNPETRAYIERLLAEQAQQAGATGDMEFLGYTYPNVSQDLPPDVRTIPQEIGEPFRPPRDIDMMEAARVMSGQEFDAFMGMNPQALSSNLWAYGLRNPNEWGEVEWDRELTYGKMLEDIGIEGARNLAAQGALGLLEPGPGELAQIAALVPQRLLRTFGTLSKGGLNAVPHYHGTPYAYYGMPRASKSGDLGPGFYITRDPSYSNFYTEERPFGTAGPLDNSVNRAGNVRPGYVAGRVLDIDNMEPMSSSEARALLEPIRTKKPGFYEDMMRRARRGQLNEAELWREAYDLDIQSSMWADDFDPGIADEPAWLAGEGNELLRDMGYVGAYSNYTGEGVVWDPAKHYIAPWDVDGMLRAIAESDAVPPEEVFEISKEVADWMARWSSQ